MVYDLIIVAGEPSGDQHAAEVLKQLKLTHPDLKIAGVCGPYMQAAYPMDEILNINKLSIMGFVDVLLNLPKLYFYYRKILRFILSHKAKVVLFIDYPGMNLKLGQTLKKKGFEKPIFHYIAPTAWAWKKNRVKTLKTYCHKLFCILPFEEAFFTSYGIKAQYVGNPLVKKLKPYLFKKKLNPNLVAIFPGSRVHEIEKNLHLMLETCFELKKQKPELKFSISMARPELEPFILKILKNHPLHDHISLYSHALTTELMLEANVAIAKSGTCILELALLNTPTVVIYAISKLDLFIATKIFKINLPYYSLPNLILNKPLFKELYGPYLSKESLLKATLEKLTTNTMTSELFETLKQILGDKDPSIEIANALHPFFLNDVKK